MATTADNNGSGTITSPLVKGLVEHNRLNELLRAHDDLVVKASHPAYASWLATISKEEAEMLVHALNARKAAAK